MVALSASTSNLAAPTESYWVTKQPKDIRLPLLITFQGKPIKRRERFGDRLKLILFSPIRGAPGEQMVVTQDEWQRLGRIEFLQRSQMPNVRRMADR